MSAVATKRPAEESTGSPVKEMVGGYFGRVKGGDMGALPALIALIALCVFFWAAQPTFMSTGNLANLFTQGAAGIVIAMGLVFVLLLGEIDLSAGFTSGVCAAVLAVTLTQHGWPWYASVGAALIVGALIGTLLGTIVVKIGIPSFVVTLAAFLALQGVALKIMDNGTNISIQDKTILSVSNDNVPITLGWVIFAIGIIGFGIVQFLQYSSRRKRGLVGQSLTTVLFKVGGLAVVCGIGVYLLSLERSRNPAFASLKGMPIVVPLILILLVVFTFVLNRTSFGRHIYAVGGNQEAARRAGINVDRIRVTAFVLCSAMAAIGGIIAASRANSVDPNTGGSDVLLKAVGAAVIGGTSLFGGRGRMMDAILGGMVIAVIDNGMGLMGYSAGTKFIVTGLVLLLAAGVDALSRRRSLST
ncbi:D-xylose transport system permease protein [Actinocorallia herbida]|uniref:Xylose transport system permease protein XylH n=1 Tax=Actinocorallia herbida TaxID=58109 RepID=A0A3N1CSE2_9ACTN|nr:ABC transporter permease [Actinocorallia herbida]ROO84217.1 D-xylose transport system permease protein [Actinocorallia herbida]